MKTLADLFEEEEARPAPVQTEAEKNRAAAKRQEEHDRGVRLGWWDKDGNFPEEEEEEEEEEED